MGSFRRRTKGISGAMGRLLLLIALVAGTARADGRTVASADATLSVNLPEDWRVNAPAEGPVKLLLVGADEEVAVTVLREPLGSGPVPTTVRLLFLKLDNFARDFPVEKQSDPTPVFIDGEEAARAEFLSEIRQANGKRVKSAFVFTCLARGGYLYTVVGTTRAEELEAWRPVLDAVTASLVIR